MSVQRRFVVRECCSRSSCCYSRRLQGTSTRISREPLASWRLQARCGGLGLRLAVAEWSTIDVGEQPAVWAAQPSTFHRWNGSRRSWCGHDGGHEHTEHPGLGGLAAVERDPQRVSGAWVLRGTHIPVVALFDNLEDGVPLADFVGLFPGVSLQQARRELERPAQSTAAVAVT